MRCLPTGSTSKSVGFFAWQICACRGEANLRHAHEPVAALAGRRCELTARRAWARTSRQMHRLHQTALLHGPAAQSERSGPRREWPNGLPTHVWQSARDGCLAQRWLPNLVSARTAKNIPRRKRQRGLKQGNFPFPAVQLHGGGAPPPIQIQRGARPFPCNAAVAERKQREKNHRWGPKTCTHQDSRPRHDGPPPSRQILDNGNYMKIPIYAEHTTISGA